MYDPSKRKFERKKLRNQIRQLRLLLLKSILKLFECTENLVLTWTPESTWTVKLELHFLLIAWMFPNCTNRQQLVNLSQFGSLLSTNSMTLYCETTLGLLSNDCPVWMSCLEKMYFVWSPVDVKLVWSSLVFYRCMGWVLWKDMSRCQHHHCPNFICTCCNNGPWARSNGFYPWPSVQIAWITLVP